MDSTADHSLTEKYNRLSDFANKFRPGLESLGDQRRLVGTGDILTFLYTLPLAVIGIIWLVFVTNLQVIQTFYIFLTINFGLLFLFRRLSFFTIFEIRADRYGSSKDSLAAIIQSSLVGIGETLQLQVNAGRIYAPSPQRRQ